jgi:hypothetical protein
MYAAVVLGFDPRAKQPVQLAQISDIVAAGNVRLTGDLNEELIVDGAGVGSAERRGASRGWSFSAQPAPEPAVRLSAQRALQQPIT